MRNVVAKRLRKLAGHTHESHRRLKKGWMAMPRGRKEGAPRHHVRSVAMLDHAIAEVRKAAGGAIVDVV